MPYGKFKPAKTTLIKNRWDGHEATVSTPDGYGGLFWGRVYDAGNTLIFPASDYFMRLAEDKQLDTFEYWNILTELIDRHCVEYLNPLMGQNLNYNYQSGFGGDDCDGLIDFWLPVQVPDLPDMPFTIEGKPYVLKWQYSPGGDDDE